MPRSFIFSTITEYRAAKASSGTVGAIYAELVSSGIKSGSVVSKITATGDVFIDSINPFVTPDLGQDGDTLYYSSTEGYRFLRAGNSAWDADSLGQVYIDLAKIPSGFSKVEPFVDEFVYKRTTENIGSGKASMTKILGNSLAWNQICSDGQTDRTFSNVQFIGSYSFGQKTVIGHKYFLRFYYNLLSVPQGANFRFWVSVQMWGLGFNVTTKGIAEGVFTSSVTSNSAQLYLAGQTQNPEGGTVKNLIVVDLTLLYGSAIDGLTDAQILAKFESEFPGYHSYNAGQLLSNKAKAIEFVGFNQWDEEWENAGFTAQGVKSYSSQYSQQIASKNYIPVIGGQSYCLHYVASSNGILWLYCYDANKNFLQQFGANTKDSVVTLGESVAYIQFALTSAYGNTYNHDICISISGKRNGQYEPYKKVVLPLPNLDQIKVYSHNIWDEEWEAGGFDDSTGQPASMNCIRSKNFIPITPGTQLIGCGVAMKAYWFDGSKNYLFSESFNAATPSNGAPANARYFKFRTSTEYGTTYNYNICVSKTTYFSGVYDPYGDNGILTMEGGLKSAGSVRDEIVGNMFVKKVGRVNLGDLSWTFGGANLASNPISDITTESAPSTPSNIVCSKYETVKQDGFSNTDKSIIKQNYSSANTITVRDSAYSDGNTFKTAMQNEHVQLDYKLATPIEYEIYSPTKMPFNWKYRVSEYHTKRMLPENGENPTSAPFACEIKQC